jgi:iron complex outermembrane recepter protein
MRTALVAAVSCFVLLGATATAQVHASIRKYTDIPEQQLGDALEALAHSRGVQLIYLSDDIESRHTAGAVGEFTMDEALKKLLSGTGLLYQYVDPTTISIYQRPSSRTTSLSAPASEVHAPPESADSSLWTRFRLAQADQGSSAAPGAPAQGSLLDSEGRAQLAEVIVTAQKKTERLQDVPVPLTVLSGDDLAANNRTKIQDYLASVPGLTMSPGGAVFGGSMLEIRGIGTSQYQNITAPTVGYLIDGVPYGPTEVLQFNEGNPGAPDIDPGDIARIEVLKGPQGTLYGADSLGGLINIITKDPSTQGLSGRVQLVGEDIPEGGAGYAVRGAINLPLADDLAVRLSGFDRRDAGYINNLTSGQNNANSADVSGGHMSILYQPLNNLSFKLGALVQENDSNGLSLVNVDQNLRPQFSGLQNTYLPGSGTNQYFTEAFNGEIKAKAWGIDFVSLTGFNVQKNKHKEDLSTSFGPYVDGSSSVHAAPTLWMGTAPNGSVFESASATHKLTQEIRLSSAYSDWIDWLVGGYYTHETSRAHTFINANNLQTGAYEGTFFTETSGEFGEPPTTLTEESLFGDLTAHMTDKFNIQFGGRESGYQQVFGNLNFGIGALDFFGTVQPIPVPVVKGSDSAFTWLITPQYIISSDMMVYSRIATGYQLGGTNNAGSPNPIFAPSKTINYEVGAKGTLLDKRVTFDVSAYLINWTQIQVGLFTANHLAFIANVGAAESKGVEAQIQVHPVADLRIAAQLSYNDARTTANFPTTGNAQVAINAPKGTQLPMSTHWTGNVSVDWDALHVGEMVTSVGASVAYIGARPGEFDGQDGYARLYFPSYTTLNTHITVRRGALEASLYARNLADSRGFIGGQGDFGPAVGNTSGYVAQPLQPRTIGLSLAKNF